jgi:hypothetical protein
MQHAQVDIHGFSTISWEVAWPVQGILRYACLLAVWVVGHWPVMWSRICEQNMSSRVSGCKMWKTDAVVWVFSPWDDERTVEALWIMISRSSAACPPDPLLKTLSMSLCLCRCISFWLSKRFVECWTPQTDWCGPWYTIWMAGAFQLLCMMFIYECMMTQLVLSCSSTNAHVNCRKVSGQSTKMFS